MSKQNYFEQAINWISKKSTIDVRANHEDYEATKVFTNKTTGEEIQPDFSFTTQGGVKSFTEIAIKSDAPSKLVTRWKLLSMMASVKRGKLYLLAPKGHKMFTKKLIDQYNINAVVLSL